MKTLIMLAILTTAGMPLVAHAADGACDTRAAEKKLAGAAKTSFMKKCERDASKTAAKEQCTAQAADKKLHGAAKNSFVKKCVTDAAK